VSTLSRPAIEPDAIRLPASTAERLIELLLAAMLLFAPFAYGSVEAWGQQVLFLLTAGMLGALIVDRIVRPQQRLAWTWAYAPMLGFIALASLQLLNLPNGVLGLLSPATVAARDALLADLPGGTPDAQSLSLYPHATLRDLRLVVWIVTLFVVVHQSVRRSDQVQRVLGIMALSGGAVIAWALYQNATGLRQVYPGVEGGHPFSGPFLNHSHFAQFVNLSIGAAVALLLIQMTAASRRHIGIREQFMGGRGPGRYVRWALVGVVVLGALAICLSMSRGGVISLCAALGLGVVFLAWRTRLGRRSAVMVSVGMLGFLVLLAFGFNAVYDRVASLRQFEQAEGGRLQILADIAVAWGQHPLLGTGLGTFEVVFPQYDRTGARALATHAENEYAQLLMETGVVGVGLIVAFMAVIGFHGIRCALRPWRSLHWGSIGMMMGLIAIAIHSSSDFGQHVPAIAAMTAVTAALICRLDRHRVLARTDQWEEQDSASSAAGPRASRSPGRVRRIGLASVTAAAMGWCLFSADGARVAEAAAFRAYDWEKRIAEQELPASDRQYAALIRDAQLAADAAPLDVHLAYQLAQYRWRSINRRVDPQTGAPLMSQTELGFAKRIAEDLEACRRLAPTFGPPLLLAGQLRMLVLDQPQRGEHLISLGRKLAPRDPMAGVFAGIFAGRAGDFDRSLEAFAEAGAVWSGATRMGIDYYLGEADRPDLAVALVEEDRHGLSRLAKELAQRGGSENQALAQDCRLRARQLLQEAADSPDASPAVQAELGVMLAREGDHEAAVPRLRVALAAEYGQVKWRYELARCLAEMGYVEEATREARICLRLRPQMTAAMDLMDELVIRTDQ